MKAFNPLLSRLSLLTALLLSSSINTGTSLTANAQAEAAVQWPIHDNGLNKVVQWDHYSMIVNGKRLFIWSGEMHYWRIPVPELWEDILTKAKAAGFNSVGFYSHWAYHNPSPTVLDFHSGANNFTRLFELAHSLGLYVIFRPGPYVNAETSGGALPPWSTTGSYGRLRNNDTRYTSAWKPFFSAISKLVAPYQVTKTGGNVLLYQLENEYGEQWLGDPALKVPNRAGIEHMQLLEKSARESGVDVPLFHNNPNMWSRSWSKDYSSVGGELDMYGIDHYPECWSCNYDECTGVNSGYKPFTVYEYYSHFQAISPSQPSFMPEFQGGSYNPWGGPQGGCRNNSGPDFVNVFYRHNIASRVTAINLYMMFGGTSWGGLASPNVATSYDYSAPITESRDVGDKLYETKLLGLFLRVARDLTKTEYAGNNTNYATNPLIYTVELRNPDTNGAFYITRHQLSASTTRDTFQLNVQTSAGPLVIPQQGGAITLNGRDSKIIITDYTLQATTILYSTAELLTAAVVDKKPVLAFWLPEGETGEIAIKSARSGAVVKAQCEKCNVEIVENIAGAGKGKLNRGYLIVKYSQGSGISVVEMDDGARIILMDRATAYRFWAPTLGNDPFAPEDEVVFVLGPKLVRSAKSSGRNSLAITGDISSKTSIEIFASTDVKTVTWNGKHLSTQRTKHGSLTATLQGPKAPATVEGLRLPALTVWKAADSLPERFPDYDDSRWTSADHMTTPSFFPPDTYPVLYADEYGYHTGGVLWRGRFEGPADGVFLSVKGGTAFGWTAYLNGQHLGSYAGENKYNPAGNLTLAFPPGALAGNGSANVLLVVQDNMGKDLRADALYPRGIANATLITGTSPSSAGASSAAKFTSWKVAGHAGGQENIDPVRGPLSGEGGLHAERMGWHLPGAPPPASAAWTSHRGSTLTVPQPGGISFFTTTVTLALPTKGTDHSLAFTLTVPPTSPARSKLRAQLYVNGYQFARFVPFIGNQIEFPVFPGILDYDGENKIAVTVWNQESEMPVEIQVGWKVLGVVETSFDWESSGLGRTGYLRPGIEELGGNRSQYA
ncbi:glycoside hydrolase family 35 protein [Peziza echinospora]|nr:glycoside hydrolase family 35 protein [Peziza echinospora]